MSTINDYVRNNNYGNNGFDSLGNSNSFLSGMSFSTGGGSSLNLGDWAAIRNGSYRRLMKAYYAQEKAQKNEVQKDPFHKSTAIQSSANALKGSVDAFNDASLWEKKKVTKNDEETGETIEKEDYDWDAIAKHVKKFVDAYNETIDDSVESNSADVLKGTLDMVKTMSRNAGILSRLGITIGSNNKLSFDEEELKKEADIGSLKTVFKGHNSVASSIAQKASAVSSAAARSSGIYTSSGAYSKAVSSLASGKIDKNA